MVVHYPNGRKNNVKKTQTVRPTKKPIEFGKRGMNFEEEINASNAYYLSRNIAVIHKKPTPVQIVKVDYPARSRAKITEAYFRHASTTDYNGVYQGLYLDFEAKETKNKTSFPFANFHEHQIIHMEKVIEQQGIAFVLLYFSSVQKVYFYPANRLIREYADKNTRKSLTLKEIEKHGIEIILGIAPRIPYLDAVNTFLEEKQNG